MHKEDIEEIFSYYTKYGEHDYIGENVTQIEHMIQAAMLSENDNLSSYVILAALFHDIGHLIGFDKKYEEMDNVGIKNHEKIGADFLRKKNVPEPIPELVEGHVQAKRYLTYKYKDYHDKLSDASKQTLIHQGGPMNKEEAVNFESSKFFNIFIKMRDYDDKAKVKDLELTSLEHYKNLLEQI